jgi:ferredoxin
MPEEIARIVVDREKCIGSGICVDAAPGVFALDDDAVATVVDPKAASPTQVREAAEGCPTEAIELFAADGTRLYPAR